MSAKIVIGVDPGPWTGIVALKFGDNNRIATSPIIMEVSANGALFAIKGLYLPDCQIIIGYEPFVVGNRSGRSNHAGDGRITRDVCGKLETLAAEETVFVVSQSASQLAEWASDERLNRFGLALGTRNYRHAKSAAKQAVYTACHTAGIPDPLSRQTQTKAKV